MLRAPRSLKTQASAPDGPAVSSLGKGADRNCSSVRGGGAGLTAREGATRRSEIARQRKTLENIDTSQTPLAEQILRGACPERSRRAQDDRVWRQDDRGFAQDG